MTRNPIPTFRGNTKIGTLVAMMQRPSGATMTEMTKATGWKAPSIRAAASRTLHKKHQIQISVSVAKGCGLACYICPNAAKVTKHG